MSRTVWSWEGPMTDVTFEDRGTAAYAQIPDDDEDEGLFVRIHSWSETAAHEDLFHLIGRRVRVTIEVLGEYRTKSGKILTEADIEKLADEAERGYDVSHLKAERSYSHDDDDPPPRAEGGQLGGVIHHHPGRDPNLDINPHEDHMGARELRLRQIADEYGDAPFDGLNVSDFLADYQLSRWLLIQRSINGEIRLWVFGSPSEAAEYHSDQEPVGYFPAAQLVDLDTNVRFQGSLTVQTTWSTPTEAKP